MRQWLNPELLSTSRMKSAYLATRLEGRDESLCYAAAFLDRAGRIMCKRKIKGVPRPLVHANVRTSGRMGLSVFMPPELWDEREKAIARLPYQLEIDGGGPGFYRALSQWGNGSFDWARFKEIASGAWAEANRRHRSKLRHAAEVQKTFGPYMIKK